MTEDTPDTHPLTQCVLHLSVVNNALCTSRLLKESEIGHWKKYDFSFGVEMDETFSIEVSTEIHRLMIYVAVQLMWMDCIRRNSI